MTPPVMKVPSHWDSKAHFRAETADYQKFVYCPIGNLASWHPGDYDNKWCHYCMRFFMDLSA